MGITQLQGTVGDVGKVAGVHLWDKWNLQPSHLKIVGGNLLVRFHCHMKSGWSHPSEEKPRNFVSTISTTQTILFPLKTQKYFHNFSACKLLRQQKVEAASQPSW